jgi:hypothetical protein
MCHAETALWPALTPDLMRTLSLPVVFRDAQLVRVSNLCYLRLPDGFSSNTASATPAQGVPSGLPVDSLPSGMTPVA